jgi:DNA-binding HxlR family transcriptional regulator
VEVTVQVDDVNRAKLCHARQILDRIGDKWSIEVIYRLDTGTMRFTELRRAIGGISQRMLTATLRRLERDGMVHRTVHPVVPPRVDYRLTPLGEPLLDIVRDMMDWAVAYGEKIDKARAEYDSRTAG